MTQQQRQTVKEINESTQTGVGKRKRNARKKCKQMEQQKTTSGRTRNNSARTDWLSEESCWPKASIGSAADRLKMH